MAEYTVDQVSLMLRILELASPVLDAERIAADLSERAELYRTLTELNDDLAVDDPVHFEARWL